MFVVIQGQIMVVGAVSVAALLLLSVYRWWRKRLAGRSAGGSAAAARPPHPQIIPAPVVEPTEAGGVDLSVGDRVPVVDIDLRPGQLDLGSHRLELLVTGANPTGVLESISKELVGQGLDLVGLPAPAQQWVGEIRSGDNQNRLGTLVVSALAPGYWSFLLYVGLSLPLQTMADRAITSCGYRASDETEATDPRVREYVASDRSCIRATVGTQELVVTDSEATNSHGRDVGSRP